MSTLSPLRYGKVTGWLVDVVGDGSDSDPYPDAVPLKGSILLTPTVSSVKVPQGSPAPATAGLGPITLPLDSAGFLTLNALRDIWVVATNDPATNPSGFNYIASFDGLRRQDGSLLGWKPFPISVPVFDQTANNGLGNAVDITTAAPVGSSGGTLIIQGPVGPPGPPGQTGAQGVPGNGAILTVAGQAPNTSGDVPLSIGQLGGIPTTQKGQANGVAPLASDGKVAAAYLPSYVDDVLEFPSIASLPNPGETGKIYVITGAGADLNKQLRWAGSSYVTLLASPGSTDAVPEGTVNRYYTDARADARITAQKGAANGVAKLAADGKLDVNQLDLDGVPAGYVHTVTRVAGNWPTRASITSRTDVILRWKGALPAPSIDGTYALANVDEFVQVGP